MRFPSRLLAGNLWYASMLWIPFVVIVTALTVGIAAFGTLDQSGVWEGAIQVSRWYALFVGVALVREFLPLYIAHGQTRRQFAVQATIAAALIAPFLSVLILVAYLLNVGLIGLLGWTYALTDPPLISEPAQVGLVFLENALLYLVWITVGALVGAGFYRWAGGGVLLIPLGAALVVLAHTTIGAAPGGIDLDLPRSGLLTLGVPALISLVGHGLTWLIVRDVPLRNKPA